MELGEDDIDWPRCTADTSCTGVQADLDGRCLAHVDEAGLEAALERLRQEGNFDARGVRLSNALMRRVLIALPKSKTGQPIFKGTVRFDGAIFEGDPWFDAVIFEGDAWFERATFRGKVITFHGTTFKGNARFGWTEFRVDTTFRRARFGSDASFHSTTFKGSAQFEKATFGGDVGFEGVAFGDLVWFDRAAFQGKASFYEATFENNVWFDLASFEDFAWFEDTTFRGEASFDEATFENGVGFERVVFEQARTLGRMQVAGGARLDEAVFRQRVQVEIAAAEVTACRARFLEGGHLRLCWARILLDDADFAVPSILSGASFFVDADEVFVDEEEVLADADEPELVNSLQHVDIPGPPRPGGQPWVASLCRADVAGLALSNVDLQACRFAGAHNLDQLRLESPKAFAGTPGWKAIESGWAWPPLWRWSRRQVLAEEHAWRATYECGIRQAGWHRSEAWPPDSGHWVPNLQGSNLRQGRRGRQVGRMLRNARRTPRRLALLRRLRSAHMQQRREEAQEIANLYRTLRKGREDIKDEPGAADFYYGEMEMRRNAIPQSAERLILWVYWLVSGYGLRAWRAIVATLVALTVFTVLMVAVGFQHPTSSQSTGATTSTAGTTTTTTEAPDTSPAAAAVYGARTAIGLPLYPPQPKLSRWGDALQITLRITVPVLLGLAVLSIRGRVKR